MISIIMSMFIDRLDEKRILDEIYSSKKAELVLLYGRRRVGKSRLLVESIKDEKALYLLADLSENILDIFALQIKEQFVRFSTWDDFFEYFLKSKYRILVIDEFQYLYDVNHAWPSILQRWWERFKDTDKKIILSGSIISAIYKIALGYGSALYGRKTREIEIFPFRCNALPLFLPKYGTEDVLKSYFILGGIPRYIEEFDSHLSFNDNIKKNMLDKTSFLYNEPINLLFEEFRDFTPYTSIILAITEGKNRFNEISEYSRIATNKLSKYITVLERVKILAKDVPITEKKLKSKSTHYVIQDNFYHFWFRFIFKNKAQVEQGLQEQLFEEMMQGLPAYFGKAFEKYCREYVQQTYEQYPKVGTWWHKDKEIDIVGLHERNKEILFGECKWQEKVDAQKLAQELIEKSEFVNWHNDSRKESFMLFAKSFKKKITSFNGKKITCIDLKDIEKRMRTEQ
jgi:AAA+ ATPase superfamily predicted ATPase